MDVKTVTVNMDAILRESHLEVAKSLMEDLLNLYTKCIITAESREDCEEDLCLLHKWHQNFINSIEIVSELE